MTVDQSSKKRAFVLTLVLTALVVGGAVGLAILTGGGREDIQPSAGHRYVDFDDAADLLQAHEGQPLLINFFASWCAPCRAELPELAAAHAKYGGQVKFIGIDHQDFSEEAARQMLDENGISYDIVRDPAGTFLQDLGRLPTMPTTVFVDASGEIVSRHHGLILESQLLENIQAIIP